MTFTTSFDRKDLSRGTESFLPHKPPFGTKVNTMMTFSTSSSTKATLSNLNTSVREDALTLTNEEFDLLVLPVVEADYTYEESLLTRVHLMEVEWSAMSKEEREEALYLNPSKWEDPWLGIRMRV